MKELSWRDLRESAARAQVTVTPVQGANLNSTGTQVAAALINVFRYNGLPDVLYKIGGRDGDVEIIPNPHCNPDEHPAFIMVKEVLGKFPFPEGGTAILMGGEDEYTEGAEGNVRAPRTQLGGAGRF